MFKKFIKKIIGTNQTLKINMFNAYKLSNLSDDIDNLTLNIYLYIHNEDEIKIFVTNYLNNLPITLQVLQINFNIATDYVLNKEIILDIIKENLKIPFNCILKNTVDVYNPIVDYGKVYYNEIKYIKFKLKYEYIRIIHNVNNKNL